MITVQYGTVQYSTVEYTHMGTWAAAAEKALLLQVDDHPASSPPANWE